MSRHHKLTSTATDSPEDESDNGVQSAQDRLKRKIFQRKLLICFCVCLLAFLIVAGIAVGVLLGATDLFKKDGHDTTSQGDSKVLDYIDTSQDPCKNFYKYSCGNWRSTRPDAPEWGTFYELALDNYNKLAGYLSQRPNNGDTDAIKKAKYIYSACTDTDYIQDNLVDQIKDFMDSAGGWHHGGFTPSYSWSINSNLYKDHYLGSSAFFSFGIFPDDLNSSKQVIRVLQNTAIANCV